MRILYQSSSQFWNFNLPSCPAANFEGDLVANFQSGPLAGCQSPPPASSSPTCTPGSQTLLHDSQHVACDKGCVIAKKRKAAMRMKAMLMLQSWFSDERESLFRLFNLVNWRAQPTSQANFTISLPFSLKCKNYTSFKKHKTKTSRDAGMLQHETIETSEINWSVKQVLKWHEERPNYVSFSNFE